MEAVTDLTTDLMCLAVQGPLARGSLQHVVLQDLQKLRPFRGVLAECDIRSLGGKERGLPVETEGSPSVEALLSDARPRGAMSLLITRTGYTGEDGFEIFAPNELGKALWSTLLQQGGEEGMVPVGLGARDTLRLEKGYLLSGRDFDGRQTPLEVGYERIVHWEHDFLGREPLLELKQTGDYALLRGVRLAGRGVPRPRAGLWRGSRLVGHLTSATLSPSLKVGIGLGYLESAASEEGTEVEVEIRGRRHPAVVVNTPFL